MSEILQEPQSIVDSLLKRRGRVQARKTSGVGMPSAQTLAFRSIETRRINLEVLVDSEWASQLRMKLSDPDEKVSEAAIAVVERQSKVLGSYFFEALLNAIHGNDFDATLLIDVTGYKGA